MMGEELERQLRGRWRRLEVEVEEKGLELGMEGWGLLKVGKVVDQLQCLWLLFSSPHHFSVLAPFSYTPL